MKLSRLTVCQKFDIRRPRWKQRAVGLAVYRLGEHNEIEILAANKEGERYHPDTYYISKKKALNSGYERQITKGVELVIVPIKDLELLERKPTPNQEEQLGEK